MNEFLERNKKGIVNVFIISMVLFLTYLFSNYIFTLIAPFFIGWVLSLLYEPFVNTLDKKFKIPRGVGAVLSIFLLIAFFSFVVAGIVGKLMKEANLFYEELPYYFKQLEDAIKQWEAKFYALFSLLPIEIQNFFINGDISLLSLLQSFVKTDAGAGSIQFVKGIPGSFLTLFLSILSSYFFSKDKELISQFAAEHMPPSITKGYHDIKNNIGIAVIGYIKSQLILMIFTFLISFIGLLILKSPYTLLMTVSISIIDALPFFGSGFILWPAALIELIMGNTMMAVGYMIIYLLITLERQIMQPKVLGTQIGLHPLLTLISMYLGLKFMGVIGMIVGPIIAVMVKSAYTLYRPQEKNA